MSITITVEKQVTEVEVVSVGQIAVEVVEQTVDVSVAYGLSADGHAALHQTAVVDSSGGAVEYQLPTASGLTSYTVVNAGTNPVTVLPFEDETIDGDTSLIIEGQLSAATLYAHEGDWYVG